MGGPLAALGAKSKGGPRFSRSTERARGPRFGDKVTPFVAKGLRTKREHGTKRPRKPSPINKRFRIRKPKGQDHGSGDRKSTRLNSSHKCASSIPSSA